MPDIQPIKKILIANRGEIALRISKTAHSMGISVVNVFSDADAETMFMNMAEEAIAIGGNTPAESYLNQDKIIAAAKRAGADAIHPGYGFLSENASFAKRCADEGIIFIGPSVAAIDQMGSKIRAKELLQKHGVPVIKGYNGSDQTVERLLYEAQEIGMPLLVKASAGGGGKGMRIVRETSELRAAIEGAKREALAAFGDDSVLLEKYFDQAKHIEVQIIGDNYGKVLHLFERECSVQRRFQKIIEEAPSPSINAQTRRQICAAALKAAKAIGYRSAGTVEFILDSEGDFYFLEVNTRLQVEHPVTEEITGLDIVRMQIEVAQGLPISIEQDDIEILGHAIEARLYAEDPSQDFRPASGKILFWSEARVPDIRYESGVDTDSVVSTFYDPMIAKVIASAPNRMEAAARLRKAIGELCCLGITTNRSFLIELLRNPDFLSANIDTKYVDRNLPLLIAVGAPDEDLLARYAIAIVLFRWKKRQESREDILKSLPSGWRNSRYKWQEESLEMGNEAIYPIEYQVIDDKNIAVRLLDKEYAVRIAETGDNHIALLIDGYKNTYDIAFVEEQYFIQSTEQPGIRVNIVPRFPETIKEAVKGGYITPMPGEIVKVCVKQGDMVSVNDPLLVLSSMKMENTIYAQENGVVAEVYVSEKMLVEADTLLLKIEAAAGEEA